MKLININKSFAVSNNRFIFVSTSQGYSIPNMLNHNNKRAIKSVANNVLSNRYNDYTGSHPVKKTANLVNVHQVK